MNGSLAVCQLYVALLQTQVGSGSEIFKVRIQVCHLVSILVRFRLHFPLIRNPTAEPRVVDPGSESESDQTTGVQIRQNSNITFFF